MSSSNLIAQKSKMLNIPGFDELHADCKKWLSEIAFWKDDLQALKTLTLRYADKMEDKSRILKLQFLSGQLNVELANELAYLDDKVKTLTNMLASLIQNSFVVDEQYIREEHKSVSVSINSFRTDFDFAKSDLSNTLKIALKK